PGANCCGSCEQGHTTRCRIFLPLLLAIQHALSVVETRGSPVDCRKLSSGWGVACPTSGEAPRIRTLLQPRILAVLVSCRCVR
ncbi:unnamed protein product, partial [Pylaiella littoralis]